MRRLNNICIIDDDPIIIFGIKKILKFIVECDDIDSYANGKLALEGIQENYKNKAKVPEVVFLDLNMPIMDGWQFLEAFIALPITQKVRINIVTSSIDTCDLQRFEIFKRKTLHKLSYNNKPLQSNNVEKITVPA